MTRFERDYEEAMAGGGAEVLALRKAEIQRLVAEERREKNGFRQRCIAQEVARLKREYDAIDNLF